ncbi:MAG: hypothetical protein EAX95_15050 [Candidatus Thorarchaeota archaeon]|nr:hypothetical protein [Candidatus Thorarchaeota archaeon]
MVQTCTKLESGDQMEFHGFGAANIALIPCKYCGHVVTITPPVRDWRHYETHAPDGIARITQYWGEVEITCPNCGRRFHVKFWS